MAASIRSCNYPSVPWTRDPFLAGCTHKVLRGRIESSTLCFKRSLRTLRALCKGLDREADVQSRLKRESEPGVVELLENGKKVQIFNEGDMDCIGTGTDVECMLPDMEADFRFGGTVATRAVDSETIKVDSPTTQIVSASAVLDTMLLVSPFFFWGTAMVAMKGVLPKAGPFFVASTRLIPAGLLLVGFAAWRQRKQPSGLSAWLSICIFSLVDASCFQGFLAAGLGKTSAGLGSVIIDSQPLTVAILASLLFNEKLRPLGVAGLFLGVAGLLLLEVPADRLTAFIYSSDAFFSSFSSTDATSFWDSGEWYMLLAAQSMAFGTLLVRWVCKFSDPIMATGWHMVIGGIPLVLLAATRNEPALAGHIQDLQPSDWASLAYTSVFGSAISYGVFFYNATKGSLTKLSSLTFLTPMFAALFGYIFLEESLTLVQILGATITIGAIYLVNVRSSE